MHMTVSSLFRYVVAPLGSSKVCWFVRALADPDAHKLRALLLLPPIHLAVLHVDDAPVSARLRNQSARVLQPEQAGRAAQELLQLEEAQGWIETWERRRGVRFTLVVRARLDALWNGPLPTRAVAAATANSGALTYVAPKAKTFRGLNDRLALSNSAVARLVHKRASALFLYPMPVGAPSIGTLNSEQLLNWTVAYHGVTAHRVPNVPFCLLVKRKCTCCIGVSRCTRAGAKCRPCSSFDEHQQRLNSSYEITVPWPADAAQRFDAAVPQEDAAIRQQVDAAFGSEGACRQDLSRLAALASLHAQVPVYEVCRLADATDCRFIASAGRWAGAGCGLRGRTEGASRARRRARSRM